jgi:hypothetical protein
MKCEKIENHIQIILKFLQILDQNLVKCFFFSHAQNSKITGCKIKKMYRLLDLKFNIILQSIYIKFIQ